MRRNRRRKVFTMTNAEATENSAAVAEQGANVAPEKASSKKAAAPKKGAPKGQKTGKKARKVAAKAPGKKASKRATRKEASGARAGGKKAEVIAMLQRKGGVTLDEIVKTTAWQRHTVRGFISILGSKHGMKIESTRREDGARVYQA